MKRNLRISKENKGCINVEQVYGTKRPKTASVLPGKKFNTKIGIQIAWHLFFFCTQLAIIRRRIRKFNRNKEHLLECSASASSQLAVAYTSLSLWQRDNTEQFC